VIADRTAYDVRYTGKGKLSKRFRLQTDERYAGSDSTGGVYEYERIPKLNPLKCDQSLRNQ